MLRLFVGLELSETVKSEIGLISSGLPNARWVRRENLHLTLHFIGDVDEGVAEDIDAALAEIVSPPFDLKLDGIGCFETRNKVRAVWAGVAPEPELSQLYSKVEQALIHAGLEPTRRKFKPHVTLVRLKNVRAEAVVDYLEFHAGLSLPPFAADHFTLFRSHLGHAGVAYEVIARYPLQVP
tara:strand:- start:1902 stop:2444 length:543 start_codon:yes stop_codon:yes gene_type:complete